MEMTMYQMILTITAIGELLSIKNMVCWTSVSNNSVSVSIDGHKVTVDKEDKEVFNLMCEMLHINEKFNSRFGKIDVKDYVNESSYWNMSA